jgi:hypothetical protein
VGWLGRDSEHVPAGSGFQRHSLVSAQISAIPTVFFNAKSIIHVGEVRKTTF